MGKLEDFLNKASEYEKKGDKVNAEKFFKLAEEFEKIKKRAKETELNPKKIEGYKI